MPLTQEEWEGGETEQSLIEGLHGYLEDIHPAAYSHEEITTSIENGNLIDGIQSDSTKREVEVAGPFITIALEILIHEGKVNIKTKENESGKEVRYYRAVKE